MRARVFIFGALAFIANIAFSAETRILFVGKTGAGKSTLINMIGHTIKSEAYNIPRNFLIPVTLGGLSYSNSHSPGMVAEIDSISSQTDKISSFQLPFRENEILLIDTPGILDTEPARQRINEQNLEVYLSTHLINTIALVISASDMRGTKEVINVFNKFLTLFPSAEEVTNNIVVLVTFSAQPDENIIKLAQKYLPLDRDKFFFFDDSPLIVSPNVNLGLGQMTWDSDQIQIDGLLRKSYSHKALSSTLFRQHQEALSQIESELNSILSQIAEKNRLLLQYQAFRADKTRLEEIVRITSSHTSTQSVTVHVSAGTYTERGSRHGTKRPTYTKCNACGGQNHVCTVPQTQSVTIVNQEMKTRNETSRGELAACESNLANVSQSTSQIAAELGNRASSLQGMVRNFIASTPNARLNVLVLKKFFEELCSKCDANISEDSIILKMKEEISGLSEHKI